MAGCKMYMLDMLQLQRDMEASALAVDIQTSQDEQELLDRLLGALAWLQERTKPSMFGRISERLREVLPEHALPALENALGASGEAQGEPRPGNVIDLAKRAASG